MEFCLRSFLFSRCVCINVVGFAMQLFVPIWGVLQVVHVVDSDLLVDVYLGVGHQTGDGTMDWMQNRVKVRIVRLEHMVRLVTQGCAKLRVRSK